MLQAADPLPVHGAGGAATSVFAAAELDLKKLQPAPGFKVELFAAEPQVQNPVAFSIDERGRMFVAETHRWRSSIFDITKAAPWLLSDLSFRTVADRGAFLRGEFATNLTVLTRDSELVRLVEDRDGDGRADTSSVAARGFNDVTAGVGAGVLARHSVLYYTCIPDLWRFESPGRDWKGFDVTRTDGPTAGAARIAGGFGVHIGVSGHDLHGLVLGPDGKIYFSSGDRGFDVTTREGRRLRSPDTGAVLRCNPDGSELELYCTGLRNPQELAFDDQGNLWTDDNDTAGPDDSRVLHLVEGGDYGWRCSYQHQAGFGPWCLENLWRGNLDDALPPAGTVAQGPCGLVAYPGTGLSERFQGRFLVCDFPGGIWSFGVKPRGASYEVTDREKFLWNCWPTDVDFGPDGNVYVTDWVQGWTQPDQGRIYRVKPPAREASAEVLVSETRRLLEEGFEGRPVQQIVGWLGHADRRVRLEAQFELARRGAAGAAALADTARASTQRLARLHAIWGLGQKPTGVGGPGADLTGRGVMLQTLLADRDPECRAQAARVLGDLGVREAVPALARQTDDPSPRVRMFVGISLGKLGDASAVPALVEMLRADEGLDPFVRHAGVSALARLASSAGLAVLRHDHSPAVRRAALLALRRQASPEIALFLSAAGFDAGLAYEAARAINDVPIAGAMPALADFLQHASAPDTMRQLAEVAAWSSPAPAGTNQPVPSVLIGTLRRALNACYRLGRAGDADRVAEFATRSHIPDDLRVEALQMLAEWASPPALDRVMGLFRPLPARPVEPARAAAARLLEPLLASTTASEPIRMAAVRLVGRLELRAGGSILAALFKSTESPALRREILSALSATQDPSLRATVRLALSNPDPATRREALAHAGELKGTGLAALLEGWLQSDPDLRLQQAALAALGRLGEPDADAALGRALQKLLAGGLPDELHLDLLEAAQARAAGSPALQSLLAQREQQLPTGEEAGRYPELWQGGDMTAGRILFNERADAACVRCHTLWGKGGTVGPVLDGVGNRLSRAALLESILFPNKTIATGFENVLVTLRDGAIPAGLVKEEDATELRLESPEDGSLRLRKDRIVSRRRGLSAMPEGMDRVLSRRDLRDLVEFLSAVK